MEEKNGLSVGRKVGKADSLWCRTVANMNFHSYSSQT